MIDTASGQTWTQTPGLDAVGGLVLRGRSFF